MWFPPWWRYGGTDLIQWQNAPFFYGGNHWRRKWPTPRPNFPLNVTAKHVQLLAVFTVKHNRTIFKRSKYTAADGKQIRPVPAITPKCPCRSSFAEDVSSWTLVNRDGRVTIPAKERVAGTCRWTRIHTRNWVYTQSTTFYPCFQQNQCAVKA